MFILTSYLVDHYTSLGWLEISNSWFLHSSLSVWSYWNSPKNSWNRDNVKLGMVLLLWLITTILFFSEEFESRPRTKSQLSTASWANTLTADDRSPSVCSLMSDSTQVAGEDVMTEPEERAKEDYKMIKEEKAETGRVCRYFIHCSITCWRDLLTEILSARGMI